MMKLAKRKIISKNWSKRAKVLFISLAVIILSVVAVFVKSQLLNNHSALPKLNDYEMVSGVDYVPQEVIVLANSLEQAQQKAKKYNTGLKSYSNGVAVLLAKNPEEVVKFSEQEVSFNRIYKTYQDNTPNANIQELATNDSIGLWHHKEIYTDRAWEYSTGGGVTVAVIDTGIAVNHQAFTGRISDLSYNSQSDQIGKEYVVDDYGHGSHVSGIIASSIWTSGDITVSGVVPDAEILSIKADSGEGSFELASLLRGINYAVDKGADVINMSLGRIYYSGPDELEHQAIIDAVDSGVTVIAAAGNDSVDHAGYPASYPEVIAVSATGTNYRFDSSYSNYGPEVDIAAPGTDIYSVDYASENPIKMKGTSMSSPVVAGVAALVVSQNQTYTPADVRTALLESAQEAGALGRDDKYGNGLVSAYAAVLNPSELLDVTYNLMDDEQDPVIAKVAPGSKLIRPEIYVNGQNYNEWYEDEDLTILFDFSSTIQADTLLYEGSAALANGSWLKEFPDEKFRRFAMDEASANNELSQISQDQVIKLRSQKYSTLQLQGMSINDLTGIKYFSNTKRLYCSYNGLTSLDLSYNTKLLEVWCSYNNITSVNITNNVALENLYLFENNISTIDISSNIALEKLDITMNGIQSINSIVGWQEVGLVLGESLIFDPQFVVVSQQPLSLISNEKDAQPVPITGQYIGINAFGRRGLSLKYQWYSNTTNTNTGGILIPGETSWVLANNIWDYIIGINYYYCVVSAEKDGATVASVTSDVAKVTYFEQASFPSTGNKATIDRAVVTPIDIGISVEQDVRLGSYQLDEITLDDGPTPRVLVEGIDYQINEQYSQDNNKYCVFKYGLFQDLPLGTYHITFHMIGGGGNGINPVLNLTVSDQTIPISGELFISDNTETTMPGRLLFTERSGIIPYSSTDLIWQWSKSETIDGVYVPVGESTSWGYSYTVQNSDINYYLQVTAIGSGSYTGQIISSNKVLVKESVPTLSGIEVTTPPIKKDYYFGETFDSTGLVVTAKYDDNSEKVVSRFKTSPAHGDILDNPLGYPMYKNVGVSYYENFGGFEYADLNLRLKPRVPTSLTSNVFNIDQENNLISNILENTSVEDVLDGINEKPHRNYPYVSFENEFQLDISDYFGTGTYVKIKDPASYDGNELIRTYETVVKGDTDGDGVLTAGDAYDVILHSIDKKNLVGAYLEAAKIDSNESIDAGDAYDIILHSIGKKKIE